LKTYLNVREKSLNFFTQTCGHPDTSDDPGTAAGTSHPAPY